MSMFYKKLTTVFFIGLFSILLAGCATGTSMAEMDDEDFPMEKKPINLRALTK